jgi:hypothetical protein
MIHSLGDEIEHQPPPQVINGLVISNDQAAAEHERADIMTDT